ncbi:hypothetical protein Gekk315_00079 [Aeromonas phage Gekk3-15]
MIIIIGNVNIENEHKIDRITGKYGWRGSDKVVGGSQGTERGIDVGSLARWREDGITEMKTMMGEFIMEGFTVQFVEPK